MQKTIILAIIHALIFSSALNAAPLRIYHIGNSLTWDSKPTTQAAILEKNGYTVDQGYHIACGRGLTSIVSQPEYTCVPPPEPYGKWKNALANFEWDVITIQAYPGGTGTSEVEATASIIQEAISGGRNKDCVFFLYLAWPAVSESAKFSDRVLTTFGGNEDPVFLSSGFLDYWHKQISERFPALDIRVIPTGIAFATIDKKIREKEIPPYSNTYDLYRDIHHMNLVEGRHVAMSTMLTAISGIRTKDIIYPSDYFTEFDSSFVELSNEVVWDTITSDPRTKIEVVPEIKIRKDENQKSQTITN